ncbi:MAG: ArsR/SmtB family transcription factor [Jiangellaceae bacterium]
MEADVRTNGALEALLGLHAYVSMTADDLDPDSWVAALDLGDTSLRREIAAGVGPDSGEVWLHLVGWALTLPPDSSAATLVDRLSTLNPRTLRRHLFGVDVPAWHEHVDQQVLDRAASGHRASIELALADRHYYAGQARAALGPLAHLSGAETRRRLHRAVRTFVEDTFLNVEARVVAALVDWREDHQVGDQDPISWLGDLPGGLRYEPERAAGIDRIVVIPQLAASPRLLLLQEGDTRIVGVPATGDDVASPARLARVFAALGDEQRLRILQLTAHDDVGLTDVARHLGIAKSTAHHHLTALRAAGLLGISGRAWRYRYVLRHDAIDQLGGSLRALLDTPAAYDRGEAP